MELTKKISVDNIDKIDILHDSYHDAVIKIVYETARDCQFLGYHYEDYRKRTEKYSDVIYDSGFTILWNLALRFNLNNYPCHMEDYPELQYVEDGIVDDNDDFIRLKIEDD